MVARNFDSSLERAFVNSVRGVRMSTVHQQPSTDPELDRLYADFESEH